MALRKSFIISYIFVFRTGCPLFSSSSTVTGVRFSVIPFFSFLQAFAPFKINKLHIIGGGSANELLNQWTADAIGLPVVAGPSEATAIGNIMIQAKAAGLVRDRWEMRRLIAETFSVKTFYPKTI